MNILIEFSSIHSGQRTCGVRKHVLPLRDRSDRHSADGNHMCCREGCGMTVTVQLWHRNLHEWALEVRGWGGGGNRGMETLIISHKGREITVHAVEGLQRSRDTVPTSHLASRDVCEWSVDWCALSVCVCVGVCVSCGFLCVQWVYLCLPPCEP